MSIIPVSVLAPRFWSKVTKTADCWLWTGTTSGGYGDLRVQNHPHRNIRAHRLSWILHNGAIPDGLWVLHHCDNPPCVRPEHLFLGTASDNTRDMHTKGRHPWSHSRRPTHCVNGHEFTPANTYTYWRRGYQIRSCRACRRRAVAKYGRAERAS